MHYFSCKNCRIFIVFYAFHCFFYIIHFLYIMKFLRNLRYWLEIFSIPFFTLLIIHLSSHGLEGFLEDIFSENILFILGIIFSFIFIALWNFSPLKKLVPCKHEHCHNTTKIIHIFAICAFCLHFFPASILRSQLLAGFEWTSFISIVGLSGFFLHFLTDIIVTIILSLAFPKLWEKIISIIFISSAWGFAFFSPEIFFSYVSEINQSIIFIIGAFVLAMFIHLPHKTKKCNDKHCH